MAKEEAKQEPEPKGESGKDRVNIDKLIEWLNERTESQAKCQLCGNEDWGFGDLLVRVRSSALSGRYYPLAPMVCQHCGNTLFINTLIAGIEEPDDEEGDDV